MEIIIACKTCGLVQRADELQPDTAAEAKNGWNGHRKYAFHGRNSRKLFSAIVPWRIAALSRTVQLSCMRRLSQIETVKRERCKRTSSKGESNGKNRFCGNRRDGKRPAVTFEIGQRPSYGL